MLSSEILNKNDAGKEFSYKIRRGKDAKMLLLEISFNRNCSTL